MRYSLHGRGSTNSSSMDAKKRVWLGVPETCQDNPQKRCILTHQFRFKTQVAIVFSSEK